LRIKGDIDLNKNEKMTVRQLEIDVTGMSKDEKEKYKQSLLEKAKELGVTVVIQDKKE
jgi:hypothetical protein